MLSAVRLLSVCLLSVTLVHPTQAVELFGNFFSPYDSPETTFLVPKIIGGGRHFLPEICVQSDPPPFKQRNFDQSTTRFLTSHRWTVYVTPKSPKGWHKNAISLFVPAKLNFYRKKSTTKLLCVKNFSGKVVATSFPYLTVHR